MSSIESVSAALYDIYTAKNKLAAASRAAIEWETLACGWQVYAANESMGSFAVTACDICSQYMYKVFVSEDDEELDENVYAALTAWRTIAQLWQSMTADDDE